MMTVLRARMEHHQQVQIELHCKGCILYSICLLSRSYIPSIFGIEKWWHVAQVTSNSSVKRRVHTREKHKYIIKQWESQDRAVSDLHYLLFNRT